MSIRSAILRACKALVTPWARFLLRQGISYKEFDQVARAVFVDIATTEFGIRGRPTNASRVAVLTGLTRKQVKKIREDTSDQEIEVVAAHNQATEVLGGWYADPLYVASDGSPKLIPFEGQEESFTNLVKKYGRDIPPRAMLRELKRTDAVKEQGGLLCAKSRFNVSAGGLSSDTLLSVSQRLEAFVSTVVFNLMRSEGSAGRFERRTYGSGLTDKDRLEYESLVKDRAARLLEELEDWKVERGYSPDTHEIEPQKKDFVGTGVYLFSDRTDRTL